jgi:hypothetical protein
MNVVFEPSQDMSISAMATRRYTERGNGPCTKCIKEARMLYMFLLYWNENDPPVTQDVAIREHFAFADEARARGAYVASEAVGGTGVAATVRIRNGKATITDGPFAEAKEVMGGFYVLDCRDLDEALNLAAKISEATASPTEVRPVMEVPGWDYGATARFARQPMGPSEPVAELGRRS